MICFIYQTNLWTGFESDVPEFLQGLLGARSVLSCISHVTAFSARSAPTAGGKDIEKHVEDSRRCDLCLLNSY
jgi:hypothetical protein